MRKSISSILRGSIQRKKMKGETKRADEKIYFQNFGKCDQEKQKGEFSGYWDMPAGRGAGRGSARATGVSLDCALVLALALVLVLVLVLVQALVLVLSVVLALVCHGTEQLDLKFDCVISPRWSSCDSID